MKRPIRQITIDGFWHHRLWIFALPSGTDPTVQSTRKRTLRPESVVPARAAGPCGKKPPLSVIQVKTGGITLKRVGRYRKIVPTTRKITMASTFYQREPELPFRQTILRRCVHGTTMVNAEREHPLRNVAKCAPVVRI